MSTNQICDKYAKKKVKIKVWTEKDMVYIEGTDDGLEFLGNLFLSRVKVDIDDCDFWIAPKCAGKIFFKRTSTKGLYIHRIPCYCKVTTKKQRP